MQPAWQDDPPTTNLLPHLPLIRIKPGQPTKGIITSTQICGVPTHYYGRRTLPCLADECPGCKAQLAKRWEGYISVWTFAPSHHVIWALTTAAACGLKDTAPNFTDLRGLCLTIARAGKHNNSQLRARCDPYEALQMRLPTAPDLRAHLLHIWGMDATEKWTEDNGFAVGPQNPYARWTPTDGP